MISTNSHNNFFFDTQWLLSQVISSLSQYVFSIDSILNTNRNRRVKSRQNLNYCNCLLSVLYCSPLEGRMRASHNSSVFQQRLFTLHSKENFEYIALYYFTWSTQYLFSNQKIKWLISPVTFPCKRSWILRKSLESWNTFFFLHSLYLLLLLSLILVIHISYNCIALSNSIDTQNAVRS